MKFEKFLKSVGTHGRICARNNGEDWLICGGVGMLIPMGVDTLLGVGEVPEKINMLVNGICNADTDDKVELVKATIPADGKQRDIVRIFSDGLTEIGISNEDFGLLEKSDINLAYVEVEIDEDSPDVKFLLVLDQHDNVIGFIEEKIIK